MAHVCTREVKYACPGRHEAERAGTFVPSQAHRGWIDTTATLRRDGGRWVYTNCPWCQGELPAVEAPSWESGEGTE